MKNCTYILVEFIALAEVMVDLVEEKLREFKFNTICRPFLPSYMH